MVKDISGKTLYTRGGNLQVDKAGNLLTSTGEHILGWGPSKQGGVLNTNGPIAEITVPVGTVKAPTATKSFSFDMNLNAAAKTGDTFSSSIEVFDSLGTSHIVNVTFTKNATANTWDYSLGSGDEGNTITPVTGTLTFNEKGALTDPAADGTMPAITLTIPGADDLEVNWNLYNGTSPRITQFAQTTAVSANSQDGNPAAQLIRVAIGDGERCLHSTPTASRRQLDNSRWHRFGIPSRWSPLEITTISSALAAPCLR